MVNVQSLDIHSSLKLVFLLYVVGLIKIRFNHGSLGLIVILRQENKLEKAIQIHSWEALKVANHLISVSKHMQLRALQSKYTREAFKYLL